MDMYPTCLLLDMNQTVSEKGREHYITGWLEVTLDTFLICCEMKMSNYVKVCMSNKLYHIEISI